MITRSSHLLNVARCACDIAQVLALSITCVFALCGCSNQSPVTGALENSGDLLPTALRAEMASPGQQAGGLLTTLLSDPWMRPSGSALTW